MLRINKRKVFARVESIYYPVMYIYVFTIKLRKGKEEKKSKEIESRQLFI